MNEVSPFMKHVYRASLFLIPFTLFFSARLNVLCIGLYAVLVLLQKDPLGRLRRAFTASWAIPFLLLFLVMVLSLVWTENLDRGFSMLERKASLAVFPIFIALDAYRNKKELSFPLLGLLVGGVISFWVCLVVAFSRWWSGGDVGVFFYHEFGRHLYDIGALYFSFYLLCALIAFHYLQKEGVIQLVQKTAISLLVHGSLLGGIILLSSRLFIPATLIYLLAYLYSIFRLKQRLPRFLVPAIVLVLMGVFFLSNARSRFVEVFNSNMDVVSLEEYRYDIVFNGLTLRLVFWRFAFEVLREHNAFIQGVGIGDARDEVNKVIVKRNLYYGRTQPDDKGHLDANSHNQYVETVLQCGIIGLVPLLWILWISFASGFPDRWIYPLFWFAFVIAFFFLIEAALERQRGVVFITFFLVYMLGARKLKEANTS